MCGFAGFVRVSGTLDAVQARADVIAMAATIQHRGPDHGGAWLDADAGVAFGHRRLAIIDVSPAGEQPMLSPSGRYVIIYNGEIYNHLALREELKGVDWKGGSDTETLLAAIDVWGLRRTLALSAGMFAFALWDRTERRLVLARDRLGEKPLYYGSQGDFFLFGSELKALRCHPAFEGEVDRGSLALFMRHGYVPAPHSIYRGIKKLLPGSLATLQHGSHDVEVHAYWSANAVASEREVVYIGPEDAVNTLESLLTKAVIQQMSADVPLGAFLSGGVDSSAVVALLQSNSGRRVKTFSIGFYEDEFNEADHANAVASHLGTDHTELYVAVEDAKRVVPLLPEMYDEPFADPSQIPTFLLSKLARAEVTVSLSGDGGDELFGGYNRYKTTVDFWRYLSLIPSPLRGTLARALTSLSPAAWNRIAQAAHPILPSSFRIKVPGDKIHKGAGLLKSTTLQDFYQGLMSGWRNPQELVIDTAGPAKWLPGQPLGLRQLPPVEQMMLLDLGTYLPDDILVKVDRAAMSVSLETRMPLLDSSVVEFALRLPTEYKIRGGTTKWALREVLYRYVPRALIERPKMGFGIPVGDWLRGPLRTWAEALLDPDRLAQEGYFHAAPIRHAWQEHLEGSANHQYKLWAVLMFQAWLENSRARVVASGVGTASSGS